MLWLFWFLDLILFVFVLLWFWCLWFGYFVVWCDAGNVLGALWIAVFGFVYLVLVCFWGCL